MLKMKTRCPGCQHKFEVEPTIGSVVECSACGIRLRILAINMGKVYFEIADAGTGEEGPSR